MIIHTPLAISAVAITSIATMVVIGLVHLPKPTLATTLWTAAFTTAMAGSFVWVGGDMVESAPIRGLANALIFGSMILVWSGIRAYRGVSPMLSLSIPLLFGLLIISSLSGFTEYYGVFFRVLTAFVAIFAALALVESLRLGPSVRDEVTPFVAAASLFILFTVIAIIDGILVASGKRSSVDGLSFIRGINMVGVNVLVLCTLVTVLLLARGSETARTSTSDDIFESVVRDRLKRAKASGDPWWSFIDIRLDDPDDIRIASSTAMFNEVCERFRTQVNAALPAESDIQQLSQTHIIALVPRAQGGMREIIKALLQDISTAETNEEVPVRVSASIGWAQAPNSGYNLDVLRKVTSSAAVVAQAAGGDRWERVQRED